MAYGNMPFSSFIDPPRLDILSSLVVVGRWFFIVCFLVPTIWLFNIAMENGPFIDGLPIKNGDFPWLC